MVVSIRGCLIHMNWVNKLWCIWTYQNSYELNTSVFTAGKQDKQGRQASKTDKIGKQEVGRQAGRQAGKDKPCRRRPCVHTTRWQWRQPLFVGARRRRDGWEQCAAQLATADTWAVLHIRIDGDVNVAIRAACRTRRGGFRNSKFECTDFHGFLYEL